jgi:hypothetical protein
MTTADEQPDRTVENADGVNDGADGAPQDDELSPQQKAARTRAANRRAQADQPETESLAPADLREEGRVKTGGGEHLKSPIVHLYEFDNGYGAKVYQRQRGGPWEWAPMRGDAVVRNIPGLPRVPAEATIEVINDGLALVAAIGS